MASSSSSVSVLKWVFGIVLLIVLGFFYGFIPWFLTNIATTRRFHFNDPNNVKTPSSFGMDFHPVEFRSRDGILIKGWYVPARHAEDQHARGTIVYCHGHNRTRVEMLPEARFGYDLGYSGLLFDFRHQGQSGGNISSIGYWERLDAEAAVQYALHQEKARRPVVLWGVSMGAAAALMAAAESNEVAAVISDSAFPNFHELIAHHYYLFRTMGRRRWWWFPPLPGFPLITEVIHWIGWRAHFDPEQFDLEDAVNKINPRPVLFVAVQGDHRMPPSYARILYADATSPAKRLVVLPGDRHGEGFADANQQYEQAATEFLSHLRPGSSQ